MPGGGPVVDRTHRVGVGLCHVTHDLPPSLPQIRMGFTRFDTLAEPQLAPGYGLRTYRPGDEDAWLALLSTGVFGAWDRPRLARMLAGERGPLPRTGLFFVTQADEPVGTACTFLHPGECGDVAELGWVVVHPKYRGHGLGLQVCRAVLGFVRDMGHSYIYLMTEDFRLAAIKTYLRLGFEPEMVDPSHPRRWQAIQHALAVGAGGRPPGAAPPG
jgi:mycothiol synthase